MGAVLTARAARRAAAPAAALVVAAIWISWTFGVLDPRPAPSRSPPPAPLSPMPAGPLTMGVLGTSLSRGAAWPAEAAAALAQCRGAPVDVVVAARPGATSLWGIDALDGLLAHAPDLVLIEFAINDAAVLRGVSLARSRRAHEELLSRVSASGAAPVLLTTSGAWGMNALERPGLEAYFDLYRRIAAARGARLIDIAPLWDALAPSAAAKASPDGLHPTQEAVRAVAGDALARALERIACPAAAD